MNKNSNRKIYGAYGSNMNIEQMAYRCPKAKVIGTGTLKDYKLTFRGMYKGVANVEPFEGGNVPIVLWEITKDCESALDTYEGYPTFYTKAQVEIEVGNKNVAAMIYVMTKEYGDIPAVPTEYYFSVIAKGYAENNINLRPLQIAYNNCLNEI